MGVNPNRQDVMRRLMQSGAYTEMQASVLADALEATFEQPASKVDLLEARAELRKDIGDVRQEIAGLRTAAKVGDERAERIADRTLIRTSAVMVGPVQRVLRRPSVVAARLTARQADAI